MYNTTFPNVSRLESLHHRLKTAKRADGEARSLLDELMIFLEAPPPEVVDRWQAGVEFCAAHGIATSRAAVWRFYRVHVLQWRHENLPSPGKIQERADAQLQDQAWQILPARAAETLQHPNLSPRVLVGLMKSANRREELQLARDKFDEQLLLRRREDARQHYQAIDDAAREQAYEKYGPSIRAAYLNLAVKTGAAKKEAPAGSPSPSTPPAHP